MVAVDCWRSARNGTAVSSTCVSIKLLFFKQKTAYEIKECDWSSDVCSSDLVIARTVAAQHPNHIASVTTLGAPFRGNVAHSAVLRAAKAVRAALLDEHADA